MLVNDVITKYHKIIPYPWTLRKIKKAGLDPAEFFIAIGRDLEKCEDKDNPTIETVLNIIMGLSKT